MRDLASRLTEFEENVGNLSALEVKSIDSFLDRALNAGLVDSTQQLEELINSYDEENPDSLGLRLYFKTPFIFTSVSLFLNP